MTRSTIMKIVVLVAILVVVAVGYSMMKGKPASAPVVNPA